MAALRELEKVAEQAVAKESPALNQEGPDIDMDMAIGQAVGMDTVGLVEVGDMEAMVTAGADIVDGGVTGVGDLGSGLGLRPDYSGLDGVTTAGILVGDGAGGTECIMTAHTS